MKKLKPAVSCVLLISTFTGCHDEESLTNDDTMTQFKLSSDDAHSGESLLAKAPSEETTSESRDRDLIVWVQREIEQDGFVIALGYYDDGLQAGELIEPTVMVTKDNATVPDAVVYNSLIARDDVTILAEEKLMTLRPETGTTHAHYSHGQLLIPADTDCVRIRFRIRMPGESIDSIYHVEVSAIQ